jgi:5-(carboxyamino)imidazole ribonucleotide mutase
VDKNRTPVVSIIMGSLSDKPTMEAAITVLKEAKVESEVKIVSAHRTPEMMQEYALGAKSRGIKIIIAAAGGAAHLPGMVASLTTLPVIGVPIKSTHSMMGLDSLLSIVQMPGGVPVATMSVDGASNAAIFALEILGLSDERIAKYLVDYKESLKAKVQEMNRQID